MGFGEDVSHKFLDENKLCKYIYKIELLIRSHEVKTQGY